MDVTILGPQRWPTVDQVVAEMPADARLATITAGWREREPDDSELHALLGGRAVNLGLFGRWLDVQDRDPELATAHLEHRAVVDELNRLYVVQVEAALRALYEVMNVSEDRPRTRDAAFEDALTVVRTVDELHLSRLRSAHEEFFGAWHPEQRTALAEQRDAVREILEASAAVVVAGGHVDVLLQVLHLFHVVPYLPQRVIAWSAGAMALTERVVLFHDELPAGPPHSELYDEGVGLLVGMVLLPHARRRLLVGDRTRMRSLAGRLAPAVCVILDDGARMDLTDDGALPPGARVVDTDGSIVTLEEAA